MKPSTSFVLGILVGAFAVVVADRARKLILEEDVDSLKERISKGLRTLEGTVTGLADGITDGLAEALD